MDAGRASRDEYGSGGSEAAVVERRAAGRGDSVADDAVYAAGKAKGLFTPGLD